MELGEKLSISIRYGESVVFSAVVKDKVEKNDKPAQKLPPNIPSEAVIRWAKPGEGFGVEFVDMDEKTRAYLRSIVGQGDKPGPK